MKRRSFLAGTAFLGAFALLSNPLDLVASPLFSSTSNGKLCVVLDDAGTTRTTISNLELLAEKGIPVTVAVMPQSNYKEDALRILSGYRNADILLHQPMEPESMEERGLERGVETHPRSREARYDSRIHTAIYSWDSPELACEVIHNNIANLNDYLRSSKSAKRVVGLNNHMGSLVTQKEDIMRGVAQYAFSKRLILLDSRASSRSVMYDIGKEIGARTYRNSIFIDEDTLERLDKHYEKTKDGEDVILIGHLQYDSTVDACIQFSERNSGLVNISGL